MNIKFWQNNNEVINALYEWMNFAMRHHDETVIDIQTMNEGFDILRISNQYLTKTYMIAELDADLTEYKKALNNFERLYKSLKNAVTEADRKKVFKEIEQEYKELHGIN